MSFLSKFFAKAVESDPEAAEKLLAGLAADGDDVKVAAREAKQGAVDVEKAVAEAVKAERDRAEAELGRIYAEQANAFLAAQVSAETVLPADVPTYASLIVDAYKADAKGSLAGDKSRVELIRGLIAGRGKGSLTTEAIPSGDVDAALAATGRKRLPDSGTAADSAERRARFEKALQATEAGRQYLANLAK